MRDDGRAFFGDGSYRLAGVLLRKEDTLERDVLPTLERDGASSEEGSSGDERGGTASDSSTASTGGCCRWQLPLCAAAASGWSRFTG